MPWTVRALLRHTRVLTASGVMIGWLDDIELDLYQGKVTCISVVASRFWRFSSIWIPRENIIRWDADLIIVMDAWADEAMRARVIKSASASASCYAKRSRG